MSATNEIQITHEITYLRLAVMQGDHHELARLLREGGDPNTHDDIGTKINLLELAMTTANYKAGAKECAALLLSDDRTIPYFGQGRSAVTFCASMGWSGWLERLLLKGASANESEGFIEKTALSHAVESGDEMTLKTLMKHGADPNKRDKEGCVPLHYCALKGDLKLMSILMQHPNIDVEVRNFLDRTPLFYAKTGTVTKYLLANAADPKVVDSRGETPLSVALELIQTRNTGKGMAMDLLRAGADPNSMGQDDRTPLMKAVTGEAADLVRLMLKYGGDPYLEASDGESAIHLAEPNQRIRKEIAAWESSQLKLDSDKGKAQIKRRI